MSGASRIEWTEQTWNPIVGCSIISPGCTNCYAMKMAARIQKMNRTGGSNSNYENHYDGTTKSINGSIVWTGKIALAPPKLFNAPLSRKKPTTYFVNSMGDLFHEDVPDEWIDQVFAVMALCPQHTFQVLTKRAERMRNYCTDMMTPTRLVAAALNTPQGDVFNATWPLPNVWLGVSAERQQEWDERKEYLRRTPAAVRFASFEPLLGSIVELNPISDYLQWAIVGGESGPRARPMHPDWARYLRDACIKAGVPFFFKQWGEWAPRSIFPNARFVTVLPNGPTELSVVNMTDGVIVHDPGCLSKVGKKAAGRLLDGIEHNGFPERSR